MRPHEEEWTEGDNWIANAEGGVVFEVHLPAGPERTTYRRLARAAPDMARALLAIQRCEVAGSCTRCAAVIRKALQKAGVL